MNKNVQDCTEKTLLPIVGHFDIVSKCILTTNGSPIATPVNELCPCVSRASCPQNLGTSSSDEFYLNTFMKCPQPDETRCCGASIETKDVDAQTAPEITTIASPVADNAEITTFLNELNAQTESTNQIELTTESDSTAAYEATDVNDEQTTAVAIPVENIEGRSSGTASSEFYSIENENVDTSNPSYMKIINNSPAMLVYVAKDDAGEMAEFVDLDAITTAVPTDEIEEIMFSIGTFNNDKVKSKLTEELIVESAQKPYEISIDKTNAITEKPVKIVSEIVHNHLNELNEDSNDLKTIENVNENNTNVITTLGVALDVSMKDLASTVETDNQFEIRNNKRRNSIYDATSAITLANESNASNSPIPDKDASNKQSLVELVNEVPDNQIIPRKLNTEVQSIDAIENLHKQQIMEVQSILSAMSKQSTTESPKLIRSSSLEEMVANTRRQFKPSLGRRRQSVFRTTTPVPTTTVTTTEPATETVTPADKWRRKYTRRLPVRNFSEGSTEKPRFQENVSIKTTTTTETPNESEIVSTTYRSRFTRRRLTTKPPSVEATTVTQSTEKRKQSIPQIKHSEEEFSEKAPISPQTAIEKRKKLFSTRQRGSWKPTTVRKESTTEEVLVSSTTTEANTTKPTRNILKNRQHRFQPKLNRSSQVNDERE